jgi:23S rRNA (uridine2552-2'-O)-methyltransferase
MLDLGCAPGGWLQVAKKFGPKSSKIVGIDLLKIEKIDNVISIEKNIFDEDIEEIIHKNFSSKVELLMSDMSPNSSGNQKIDHLRIISMIERVLEIAKEVLKPKGILISKIFQGGAQGNLIHKMKQDLSDIKYFKPRASRKQSPETYLIAKKN